MEEVEWARTVARAKSDERQRIADLVAGINFKTMNGTPNPLLQAGFDQCRQEIYRAIHDLGEETP